MILIVSSAGTRLAEQANTKGFKVVTEQLELDEVVARLLADGYQPQLDNDRLWISIDQLRHALDPSHLPAFEHLMSYAKTLGFLSADSAKVRVHVERGRWSE